MTHYDPQMSPGQRVPPSKLREQLRLALSGSRNPRYNAGMRAAMAREAQWALRQLVGRGLRP